MKYREQIEEYFDAHRDELVRDVMSLVSIRSVDEAAKPGKPYGDGPAAALAAAEALARSYGFTDVNNVDNYVSTVTYGEGDVQLGILAHLDVVPEGSGWTMCAPYEPKVIDGRIYGRGSSDDKGPAVASLLALRCVKDLGLPMKHKVRLILGAAEETGSTDIAYYFKKEPAPPMTFSPDGDYPILNTEKGQLCPDIFAGFARSEQLPRIRSINGGMVLNAVPPEAEAVIEGLDSAAIYAAVKDVDGVTFEVADTDGGARIVAKGKNAHASTPAGGRNAVTALIEALLELPLAPCAGLDKLRALHELVPHGETDGTHLGIACADEITGPLTVSLDMFTYTETGFRARLDSRVPLCGGEERLYAILEGKAKERGLEAECMLRKAPHHTPEDTPLVAALKRVFTAYTGQEATCVSMGGGTYVHEIEGGVCFGCEFPGEDTHMHSADEWVSIDTLVLSGKMFAQTIADLCCE